MNDAPLLELIAPATDEVLLGAVFTTFALNTRFLEEEVLTTLTGLPVGSGELGRARSELHERLLDAEDGVTVFTDARRFEGGRHVGAYDLHQIDAPPTFHPKVSLCVWKGPRRSLRVRALIASANLTTDGFRQNAEIVVQADSSRKGDHRLLSEVTDYLRVVASGHPAALDVLERSAAALAPNSASKRTLLVSRQRSLLDLFFDRLDEEESVKLAVVVSPFFERDGDASSASLIDEWCRRVAERGRDDVPPARFFVPERFVDGKLVIELPISKAISVLGNRAELWTINSLWPVEGRADPVPRRLHGKLIAVETERRCLVLAGSANFSNAAMLARGNAANWEASVLMSLPRAALDDLLPSSTRRRNPSTVRVQPPKPEPPVPALLFERAIYEAATRTLRVKPQRGARASGSWKLCVDGDPIANGARGALRTITRSLSRHPVSFSIEQVTSAGSRHIPMQVRDKENLPLPGEGLQPKGEDVLDYFAGLRTPGEFDASQTEGGLGRAERKELPALEHLSRFSRALFGIQDFLQVPARSRLEYRARWTGAWGLQRVIDLLEERIASGRDDPAYSLFELWELEATLLGLLLPEDERCPAAVKEELCEAATSRVRLARRKVEKDVKDREAVILMRRAYHNTA